MADSAAVPASPAPDAPAVDAADVDTPQGGGADETPVEPKPADLEAELAKLRKANKDYRDKLRAAEPIVAKAREAEEAQLTELEKVRAELDQERATRVQAELESLRTRVAAKHGLPPELAVRLSGDDEEALEEDALALKEFIKPAAPASHGSPDAGPRSAPTVDYKSMSPAELAAATRGGRNWGM